MKKQLCFYALSAIVLFAACNKQDALPPTPKVQPANGIYITSDGFPNGTLSYYDFASKTVVADFYKAQNDGNLGANVNDMIIYGSKMYIVVNLSNTVVVADAHTAKNIKNIYFTHDGTANTQGFEPRFAAASANYVFITCSDGYVSVIDTASLSITKRIKVGSTPEGIIVVGNNLYVANSGWKDKLAGGRYDSTVSVIDINTLSEKKKIKTTVNGYSLAAAPNGVIYETNQGGDGMGYGTQIYVIKNNVLQDSIAYQTGGKINFYNGKLYAYNYDYNTMKPTVSVIDPATKSVSNFITDGTIVPSPYGLNIDETNGDVYVTSNATEFPNPGSVYCFDKTGKKKFDFSLAPNGIGPNKVVFLR